MADNPIIEFKRMNFPNLPNMSRLLRLPRGAGGAVLGLLGVVILGLPIQPVNATVSTSISAGVR